eukprot:scaffold547_cov99-Isochrysis_galbana.AAC.6
MEGEREVRRFARCGVCAWARRSFVRAGGGLGGAEQGAPPHGTPRGSSARWRRSQTGAAWPDGPVALGDCGSLGRVEVALDARFEHGDELAVGRVRVGDEHRLPRGEEGRRDGQGVQGGARRVPKPSSDPPARRVAPALRLPLTCVSISVTSSTSPAARMVVPVSTRSTTASARPSLHAASTEPDTNLIDVFTPLAASSGAK